jgi:hypothetical protein
MPWCPRCDEIFPGGSTCPRCRSRLEAPDAFTAAHNLQPVDDLPQLKVPRRYRRAFERLSEPKAPSQRVLIVAATALVFAVGFLFGRILSRTPSPPTVHALPPAVPLSTLDVDGSAAYLLWSAGDRLATIATHDLYSGEVSPRARLSPPADDPGSRTQVAALGGDLAIVLGKGDTSFVAVAPASGVPFGWVRGVEAAWESPGSLLIRAPDGLVSRWSSQSRSFAEVLPGHWSRLMQTPAGAVLRRDDVVMLASGSGSRGQMKIPHGAEVLAVRSDFARVLVAQHGIAIWDGSTATPLRVQGYEPIAAAFSRDGNDVAVTLRDTDGSLLIGISDAKGNVALKPLPSQATECAPTPAWDARGRWVYVAPGDGSVYAVEAAGGRVEGVPARLVGCGLAWFSS